MKNKSSQTSTTDQTQTAAPPSWTMPGLEQAAGAVTSAMGQIPTDHYSGQMVASMTPEQLAAIQSAYGSTAGNAGNLAGMLQDQMLPQLASFAGGTGYDWTTGLPSTSYSLAPREDLTGVINASIDPVQKNLMENILPSITNSALASGAYSGDRASAMLPGQAIRDANASMQNIAAQLGYEDYQNYENRRLQAYQATTGAAQQNYSLETQRVLQQTAQQLQALGMAPEYVNSILHTQASQGDLLKMSADLQTAQRQAQIDDALARDKYASYSPFMGLDQGSQLLTQLSGGWGTQSMQGTTKTEATSQQALLPQLIQAGIGAAMMAAGAPPGLGGGGAPLPSPDLSASAIFSLPPVTPAASMTPPNWAALAPSYGYGG